jgi:alkanesulfonate monooxygenase SsuD/methylene tetrahydromethanopterin reductase-like flavin-dependent oxidoreductase (luciferase family)
LTPPQGAGRKWTSLSQHCLWAEEEGFDSVWFEDMGNGGGGMPFIAAAAVAKMTRTVRLAVSCPLGTVHPLYPAEDGAALDNISGGRLLFAPSDSWGPRSISAYRLSNGELAERFWEALDIVRRAWAPGAVSYRGRHWSVPKRFGSAATVTPKPAQLQVPVWVRTAHVQSVARAAQLGLPVVLEPWLVPAQVREAVAVYKDEAAEPDGVPIALIRDVHVGDSADEAERGGRRLVHGLKEWYARAGWTAGEQLEIAVLVGDVDRVVERLEEYEAAGVNYLVCRFVGPGTTYRDAQRSLLLFCRCIMPRFKMSGFPEAIRPRSVVDAISPIVGYLRGGSER